MAHANPYIPKRSFSDDATSNVSGRTGVNADAIDAEFNAIAESNNKIIKNLKMIQRDDLRLGYEVVEVHTLSREVLMLLGNYRQRGVWLAQTAYTSGDVVTHDGFMYVCKTSHVSDSAFIESQNWLQFGFAGSADAAQVVAQATSAASQAISSATAAQSSATLATTKASDANASATNAATSASEAQTASTSASNSAAQATSANNAAQAAAAVAQSAAQVSGISNERIIYGDDASKTSAVASADLAVPSGFYESSNDVPSVGKWLIVNCKSQSENTVVQIALSTTDPSIQYTRCIAGGVKSAWIYKTPYETSTSNIKPNGVASVGSSPNIPRADHVHPTDTSRAPLASPSFTGTPAAPTAATGTRSTQIATTAFVGAESQIAAPTGSVYTFAGATVPTGWLKCNGALLSRTTYAALFAVIGTTYGAGDGSTTFALPDLRGEFVRGFDDARGVDTGRALGSAQAAYAGSLTINAMPAKMQSLSGGIPVMDWITINGNTFNDNTNTVVVPVTPGDCRPRNVAMHYIIKY